MRVQNKLRLLGLVTLIGMPLLGWGLSWLFDLGFPILEWFWPSNLIVQFIVGTLFGIVLGVIASWLTERSFMNSVKNRYHTLLSSLKFTWFDVFFISICAGIGEEILFRFALQSLIGVWLAALIFVVIHGYLNPKDWRISIYGCFMIVASAGFGYLARELGMLSAMVAHTAVDVYLLAQLKLEDKKPTFDSFEND